MSLVEQSVFKIITDHNIPNWESPWVRTEKYKSSGTGFCIAVDNKKYILTNSHCVQNSVLIKAVKRGYGTGFVVKVVAILYECDLALLSTITDDLDNVEPLQFRKLPDKLEKVRVIGYPLGGHNISITSGIVNRVVMVPYMNIAEGIALQIDAAINFGNSGGPVVDRDGYVVGVAFSTVDVAFADNMGYIIPTILINFFISAWINGSFPNSKFIGLGRISIRTQAMLNKTLREMLDLKVRKGVLITETQIPKLHRFDVLLELNGYPVFNDGTMYVKDIMKVVDTRSFIDIADLSGNALDTTEVLPWNNMIRIMHPGTIVKAKILRKGVEKRVKLQVEYMHFNIPQIEYQDTPRYYTIMGMVFVPLTQMLIRQLAEKHQYVSSLREFAKIPIPAGDEYVVLSDIFITDFTEEFPQDNYILDTVNEIGIKSLKHLEQTIDKILKNKKGHLIFAFKDNDQIAVLNIEDVLKYSETITSEYVR